MRILSNYDNIYILYSIFYILYFLCNPILIKGIEIQANEIQQPIYLSIGSTDRALSYTYIYISISIIYIYTTNRQIYNNNNNDNDSNHTEISDLEFSIQANEQILRFDIPMNNVFGVAIVQRLGEGVNILQYIEQNRKKGRKKKISKQNYIIQRQRYSTLYYPSYRVIIITKQTLTIAVLSSSNFLYLFNSLYSSPLAAYSKIKYTLFLS